MPKDEGHCARRFIAKIEMLRRTPPGVADAQLVNIAMANLEGDALSWCFTEDASFCRRTGGASLADDYEAFKRLYLQRYGTINSSQSYFELRNMKVGASESLLDFGQRLRDRIFDAYVVDENVKITIFINSLAEPLKPQSSTLACRPRSTKPWTKPTS